MPYPVGVFIHKIIAKTENPPQSHRDTNKSIYLCCLLFGYFTLYTNITGTKKGGLSHPFSDLLLQVLFHTSNEF